MTCLRLVTYNVRRCLGVDGRLSPERIAQVLSACQPDIVALQELDIGRARSEAVDQAKVIAGLLKMHLHFHAAMRVFEELYGDAILTILPSRLIKAGPLPGMRRAEPRGALWARLEVPGGEIDIINTHLGLSAIEQRRQVETLLGEDWAGAAQAGLVMTGDFNAVPLSRTYRRIARVYQDANRQLGQKGQATFPSTLPLLRLDHVFVGPAIQVVRLQPERGPLARLASDHLPLMMDFCLRDGAAA